MSSWSAVFCRAATGRDDYHYRQRNEYRRFEYSGGERARKCNAFFGCYRRSAQLALLLHAPECHCNYGDDPADGSRMLEFVPLGSGAANRLHDCRYADCAADTLHRAVLRSGTVPCHTDFD